MRGLIGAALAAMVVAAPVQAACWQADHVSAARVRDLQTFLMVETLRCQAVGFDISADYNAFVRANRTALGTVNDQLKGFFIKASGPVYGQSAYDRFTTTLANAYGSSRTNADTCEHARATAHEAALMDNSFEGLLLLADRQGLAPALPGGRCGETVMAAAGH